MSRLKTNLLEIEVWKRLLKTNVYIYPDGFYRLSGIFGHSATFGFLKFNRKENVSEKDVQTIRDRNGTIKEPWLTKLAHFMRDRISRDNDLLVCDNHVLVVLGIMKLIAEANMLKNEKQSSTGGIYDRRKEKI